MPYPVFHIGTNGFFGLLFRKWIDPAVIVLVNVIVDIEVLFAPGWPYYHRYWHFHSFLVGGVIGVILGLVCWFFRRPFNWVMRKICIVYEARLPKMLLAGVVGVWIHVILDSFYHWDVQPFWPYKKNVLWYLIHPIPEHLRKIIIPIICLIFTIAAIILYIRAVIEFNRKRDKTTPLP